MNKDEMVFKEIKTVISVISLLQAREKSFRNELSFFKQRWQEVSQEDNRIKKDCFLGAFKRLEHEVMFFCIDAYGLHEGIVKQKSLFSKIIKNSGNSLSKLNQLDFLKEQIEASVIEESGEQRYDLTSEEKNYIYQQCKKAARSQQENSRSKFGFSSKKHEDIDEWLKKLLDKINQQVEQLTNYRDKFAHRLNTLEKLKLELEWITPDEIESRINTVSIILETYKTYLQRILEYTISQHFLGSKSIYDSLSRIKEKEVNLRNKKLYFKTDKTSQD